MRLFAIALALGSLTLGSLLAQTPPPQPQADKNAAAVDAVLQGWEAAMSGMSSMTAQCTRTTLDKSFGSTDVFEGTVKFLKAGVPGQQSRASLEMYKKGRPEVFEKYICTGNFLYEYAPATKTIRVHDLPVPKTGAVSDDSFLGFVFGMKAVHAKQRYNLQYVSSDQHYHYMLVYPKTAEDKSDFSEARLVLTRATNLPRQIWFRQPNGNEVSWDFPRLQAPSDLKAEHFAQPQTPAGWKMERSQAGAPKVRP